MRFDIDGRLIGLDEHIEVSRILIGEFFLEGDVS